MLGRWLRSVRFKFPPRCMCGRPDRSQDTGVGLARPCDAGQLPLPETLQAAQALWIPGPLVQVAVLTYRYVFVFNAELSRLRIALRARGYHNRVSLHSYRTAGHVAGVLLVRGYEQGERVGHAMRCRGFDGRFHSLTEFHTRPVDVAAFVLTVGCSAAILVWDVLVRE